ncbi:hypothetical protein C923_01046 [Plasmodium falciparum UGT5.1]|uniref:Uncharacterized protein n=2 Tax=Plasmodium falciparum TaxID=5833 RepID=A0A024XCT0_PLAFC|nr:hypothetical protein PFMC_00974 [Plasmodium falciparum CAMP/Malaysia]EWC78269.1 hypothetical protein C923_01046 [Plasmodium falciparum UGT5.1]
MKGVQVTVEQHKKKYNNYDIFCKDVETHSNETSLHPNFPSTIQLQINKNEKKKKSLRYKIQYNLF